MEERSKMKDETKPRIRTRSAEMDFTHGGKILTAVYPFYGPANARTLQTLIQRDGYRVPTAPELASFAHEYFGGSDIQAREFTQIMRSGMYFRGYTGILSLKDKKTIHFIDKPQLDVEDSRVSVDNLIRRIGESRARIPFRHFRNGIVGAGNVKKHPYFVAWGEKEGAEKLAEIASNYADKEAYIFNFPKFHQEPEARITKLTAGWYSRALIVVSSDFGAPDDTYAFGILEQEGAV